MKDKYFLDGIVYFHHKSAQLHLEEFEKANLDVVGMQEVRRLSRDFIWDPVYFGLATRRVATWSWNYNTPNTRYCNRNYRTPVRKTDVCRHCCYIRSEWYPLKLQLKKALSRKKRSFTLDSEKVYILSPKNSALMEILLQTLVF